MITMALGSYIRFFLGILLSIEVLRLWITGGSISSIAIILAVVSLILAAAYFAFRF